MRLPADTGTGVIVLTDMFGGTPSNLAISILKEAKIEVIAEVNLPLLVKLAGVRKTADLEAIKEAYAAGRKYIKLASELLDDPRLIRLARPVCHDSQCARPSRARRASSQLSRRNSTLA